MTAETKDEKIERLITKHIKDRNMDPKSISTHYSLTDFGIRLDPDFFETRLSMGHGFFKDKPRHLDHITRNLLISSLLAFRDRPGCYHQGKKAVMMGASYEQMLEAYEAAHYPGGGPVLMCGMEAIKRMYDEGIRPGCQQGPYTNVWVQLGPKTPRKKKSAKVPKGESRVDRIIRLMNEYHPDPRGQINKDLAFGAKLDPEFFEGYVKLSWGVFDEKECHLDPIRREMATMLVLAFRGLSEELYIHMRKAVEMGATQLQLLECFEISMTAAGAPMVCEGLRALRRITEEGGFGKRKK